MRPDVLYYKYKRKGELRKMTTFTMIILILFVSALAVQFVASIEHECFGLSILFGFEILAFAYLAQQLMG